MSFDVPLQTNHIALLVAVVLAGVAYAIAKRSTRPPYPPGPRRLPLLGNLLNFPSSFEWITYDRWSKELGSDIIYLHVAGKDIIVLSSLEATFDLLDNRSSNYSSRPSFPMTVNLMGYGGLMPFMPYGEAWRERRKALVQHFRPTDTTVYQDTHIKFVREMLPRLLVDPEDFLSTIRHAIGGSALSMAYGLPIKQEDDPIIELAEKALTTLNASVLPTNFLVNALPALQYVPEFLPGSGFKAKAREWKKLQEEMKSRPFNMVDQRMKNATATPSFTSTSLERIMHMVDRDESKLNHQREVIKDTASAIFIGATDTTQVAIQIFILAMLCYPDVQKKAQAELDRVLGGRLPEHADETDLPYITAVVKECLRWKPLAPIAVPHLTSKEDTYRGYYIPEGAIIIANSWALLQDERTYPSPTTVIPERFLKNGKLDPTVQDPVKIIFGYGRRACPGTHIALSLLWLTVASILKTFDISKAVDDDGNVIEPSMEFHAGVVCEPLPFKCRITPRSKEAINLIKSVELGS